MKFIILFFVTILFIFTANGQPPATGMVRGKIVDVNGALVRGASVKITNGNGLDRTVQSNQDGEFSISNLATGKYSVSVSAHGFAAYQNADVDVVAGKTTALDITLSITVNENVTVAGDAPINTNPEANASAIVMKGEELKQLPDDPTELEAALQALAGPAAGPNGGEILIDGFSGGKLPPRNSIREIRINQNPFSSEYDKPGFGRIEILTKPGADSWKGEVGSEFEDESFNSRNPFATNRPPFQLRNINGNFGGPIIKKRASMFFDGEKENIDNNALINAVILGPTLVPQTLQRSVLSPLKTYEFNSRVDYQLSESNTLIARFLGSGSKTFNAGLGGYDLPSRAYDSRSNDETLRLTDTQVISPTVIDEGSFQYIRVRSTQTSTDKSATVRVLDAFTSGGANVGNAYNHEDRVEFQNFSTLVRGGHVIKFGGRLRHVDILDSSPSNFAGTFTFSTLDQYRNAILRVPGGLPTQFSIAGGNPVAEVKRTDAGLYIQDDWRLHAGLTISLGLRY
ncbi:MAG TPA: carboxypeptidase regulatory-like domain-containing protein, partial [Pyrinomonadaceae bacterium]|nr:carboxypeptidase regulatory-like domain-containing protein [Pyrinomonadaceae bacterium]